MTDEQRELNQIQHLITLLTFAVSDDVRDILMRAQNLLDRAYLALPEEGN